MHFLTSLGLVVNVYSIDKVKIIPGQDHTYRVISILFQIFHSWVTDWVLDFWLKAGNCEATHRHHSL